MVQHIHACTIDETGYIPCLRDNRGTATCAHRELYKEECGGREISQYGDVMRTTAFVLHLFTISCGEGFAVR